MKYTYGKPVHSSQQILARAITEHNASQSIDVLHPFPKDMICGSITLLTEWIANRIDYGISVYHV